MALGALRDKGDLLCAHGRIVGAAGGGKLACGSSPGFHRSLAETWEERRSAEQIADGSPWHEVATTLSPSQQGRDWGSARAPLYPFKQVSYLLPRSLTARIQECNDRRVTVTWHKLHECFSGQPAIRTIEFSHGRGSNADLANRDCWRLEDEASQPACGGSRPAIVFKFGRQQRQRKRVGED